jgi:hypothetical protein
MFANYFQGRISARVIACVASGCVWVARGAQLQRSTAVLTPTI